jgi:beta-lactamase class A
MSPLLATGGFADAAASLLADVGATGSVYAESIDTGLHVALDADVPVVTASVFKIAILLELHRQGDAGELGLADLIRVTDQDRVFGPTGLSCFTDPVVISIRDLSVLMISISDNTATDVLLQRVGLANVNATLQTLGLSNTFLTGSCRELLGQLIADIGLAPTDDPMQVTIDRALLQASRALRPQTTTRSTARDMTSLLTQIWRSTAAPANACEQIRRTLGLQAWAHGIRAGLAPGMAFAGKSGTLPGVRNEAGVVTTADGERIALSVFIQYPTDRLVEQRADVDATIAGIGRCAVLSLTEEGR